MIAAQILGWYDRHARQLPWRVSPQDRARGARPNPYHIWLSEIMLQQTTVAAVSAYFERFTQRWPDIRALAHAEDAEVMAAWAGLGYYARARNLLATARCIASEHGGLFPRDEAALRALPGIGPYTAAAIRAIAYDEIANVVDGNIERVMARLHAVETPLPKAKAELTTLAATHLPPKRCGDYAQALMDLGATICTPKSPDCVACPIQAPCKAHGAGIATALPRKAPKSPKPRRYGQAYVIETRAGAIALIRRPPHGLLGGTLGFPTSQWQEEGAPALWPGEWQRLGSVSHVFTHFHLGLEVYYGRMESAALPVPPEALILTPREAVRPEDMPTVMRKIWALI